MVGVMEEHPLVDLFPNRSEYLTYEYGLEDNVARFAIDLGVDEQKVYAWKSYDSRGFVGWCRTPALHSRCTFHLLYVRKPDGVGFVDRDAHFGVKVQLAE